MASYYIEAGGLAKLLMRNFVKRFGKVQQNDNNVLGSCRKLNYTGSSLTETMLFEFHDVVLN